MILAQAILEALGEISGLAKVLVAGKELSRAKYNAEAGQQYIFADERSGKYKDMKDKEIAKWKLHWRKRSFDIS